MPKIIFRPNPTPPPFVPPTPGYATQLDFYVKPIPYESYETIEILIPNVAMPEYDLFVLQQKTIDETSFEQIFDSSSEGFNFGSPFYSQFEKDYDGNAGYRAVWELNGEPVLTIPAYIHLLED
jgi:hypothetical protein